ncbi:MAG: hypothetical protein O2954_01240 [bacterium]|nr:hypothetical protein [bacterium]
MSSAFSDPIVRIEKVILPGKRPRVIGNNARIGNHGDNTTDTILRVHTRGGAVGVGWARITQEEAQQLLGKHPSDLFELPHGSNDLGQIIDLPLWDLAAKCAGLPLYQLLGARGSREVEVYDGSIYIDDLDASDDEVPDIFHQEVRTGQAYGYANFKIKIGRGARWMPIRKGLDRDVQVIHAVREAAGEHAKILIDANMGNTLNTAKEILERCADANIYWFEEPFAEDPALNRDFKEFITEKGYNTLVADGEYAPPPYFFDLVENGWIDVVQQDFRFKGLTWWKAAADRIEPWGAQCGPHTWGSTVEHYPHAHFAASVPHYTLLEACPVDLQGLILDGWEMRDSKLIVPDLPGAGFDVEPDMVERRVKEEGGFVINHPL